MTSAEAGLTLAFVKVRSATDKDVTRGKKWYRLYSRFLNPAIEIHEDNPAESYYHGQFDNEEEALYSLFLRHEEFGLQFSGPYVKGLLRDHTF